MAITLLKQTQSLRYKWGEIQTTFNLTELGVNYLSTYIVRSAGVEQ